MKSPIPIKIALTNIGGKVNADEVYQYIESSSIDLETYQIDSSKITAAAVDYIAILNVIGSIASVASLLWMAYSTFIAPKKQTTDSSGIYIVIYLSEKERIEFWLGNTHKDKDIFIQEFTKKVTKFSSSKFAKKEFDAIKREITQSGVWKKRK